MKVGYDEEKYKPEGTADEVFFTVRNMTRGKSLVDMNETKSSILVPRNGHPSDPMRPSINLPQLSQTHLLVWLLSFLRKEFSQRN
jgi:hypothetical protein